MLLQCLEELLEFKNFEVISSDAFGRPLIVFNGILFYARRFLHLGNLVDKVVQILNLDNNRFQLYILYYNMKYQWILQERRHCLP